MFSRLCIVRSDVQSAERHASHLSSSATAAAAEMATRCNLVWHDQSTTCKLCIDLTPTTIDVTGAQNSSCEVASANTIGWTLSRMRVYQHSRDFHHNLWLRNRHSCCLHRCTFKVALDAQQVFYATLFNDWNRDRATITAALSALLDSADGGDAGALRFVDCSPSVPSHRQLALSSCVVCSLAVERCVCHCYDTLHPPKRLRRNGRLQRGALASNVLLRAFTFAGPRIFKFYRTRLMRHLARLGFASTERNGVRCCECLFAASYWDMHCIFPTVGMTRSNRRAIHARVQTLRKTHNALVANTQ